MTGAQLVGGPSKSCSGADLCLLPQKSASIEMSSDDLEENSSKDEFLDIGLGSSAVQRNNCLSTAGEHRSLSVNVADCVGLTAFTLLS